MSLHSRNRVGSYGLALFFLYKKSGFATCVKLLRNYYTNISSLTLLYTEKSTCGQDKSRFFLYNKKSMCSYGTHTSKCYPQPELGYIFIVFK